MNDANEQADRRIVQDVDICTFLCAGAAAAIAGMTLIGWLCHIPALIEPWSGQVTMKANTAAALLVSALSLFALVFFRRRANSIWRTVCQVSACLVLITGLLTILQYSTGQNFGIDQLIGRDWGSPKGTISPGRMGLNTAILLFSFGLSQVLLGLTSTHLRKIGFAIVMFVEVGAIFSLVGYLIGIPALYKISSFTEMALSTAIAFGLLSVSILGSYPNEGPFAVLSSRTAGGSVARRLMPAGILLPPLLGWVTLQGARTGEYPFEFGFAIVVLSMMMAMIVLTYWIANAVERADTARSYAEARRLQLLSTRQDFLAALMHNLKNPIIGADLVLDVVTSDRFENLPPGEVTRIFSELKQSNRSVLSMMNELIEIYQYETDLRVLHSRPCDVAELVRSCIDGLSSLAEARDVEIVTELAEDLDDIRVDPNGITRVMESLVENAIKYSEVGTEVKVVVRKDRQNLVLAVHNFGKTISDDERDALFQGFWKGIAGKSCPPVTGLGLYLCRTIVEAHHGKLTCTSEETVGTTFTVVLPVAAAPSHSVS